MLSFGEVTRLAQKLARRVAFGLIGLLFAYSCVYLKLNDEVLGNLISTQVSKSVRGQFSLKYVHYPYFKTFVSLIFNTPTDGVGRDYEMHDPDGNLVMKAAGAYARVHVRELVWSLAKFAVTRKFHLTLHIQDAYIPSAYAVIAPTRSTFGPVDPVTQLNASGAKREINLIATMTARKPPPPGGSGSELRIVVDHITIGKADFAMGLPSNDGKLSWSAELNSGTVEAALDFSSASWNATADGPYFFFQVKPLKAPNATLKLGAYEFPITDLTALEFGPDAGKREELKFRGTAKSLGANVTIAGALTDAYSEHPGVRLDLSFENGEKLPQVLGAPFSTLLSGDPSGSLHIAGPFSNAAISGDVTGLSATLGGVHATSAKGRFVLDTGPVLRVDSMSAKIAGGEIAGSLAIGFGLPPVWRTKLQARGVNPMALGVVPPSLKTILDGKLNATVEAQGNLLHPDRISIGHLDAALERTVNDRLPRKIAATGALEISSEQLLLKNTTLDGEGVRLTLNGTVSPKTLMISSSIDAKAVDASAFAARLGLPGSSHLNGIHAVGTINGPLSSPTVFLQTEIDRASLYGRSLENLSGKVSLGAGVVSVDSLSGHAVGGDLSGSGQVALFDANNLGVPRDKREIKTDFRVVNADLSDLLGSAIVAGRANLDLKLSGTTSELRGRASFEAPKLELAKDKYDGGRAVVEFDEGRIRIVDLTVNRRDGGAFSGQGTIGLDRTLGVTLKLRNFPAAAIPDLQTFPVRVAGTISGDVQLGGSLDRPVLGASINVVGLQVRDAVLGDGDIKMVPDGDRVRISGKFEGKRYKKLAIEGQLALRPKLAFGVTAKFADVELEQLFPELRSFAEVKGLATGEAGVSIDAVNGLTSASIDLTKLTLTLEGADESGRPRHQVVQNRDSVLLSYDGHSFKFDRLHLFYPDGNGEFFVSGLWAPAGGDLRAQGKIPLELLEPFMHNLFQHTDGDALVDLTLRGTFDKPILQGTFDLRRVVLVPRGLGEERDLKLVVPSGHIEIAPDQVILRDLSVQLDNEYVNASGRVALSGFQPGAVSAKISGKLSARLLQWPFNEYFADASGKIALDLTVSGTWQRPSWQGRASVENVSFNARRLGHQLTLKSGTLQLVDHDVAIGCPRKERAPGCEPITGVIDDSSSVTVGGLITIGDDWSLSRIDGFLEASEFHFATHEYAATLSPKVHIAGSSRHLTLGGTIDIVDGRYTQPFDLIGYVLRPRTVEVNEPWWQGNPLFETMALDVQARSSGPLYVKNNIADLALSTALEITGTMSDPRISGFVQVEEGGRINIPALRMPNGFITNAGQVYFDRAKSIPDETPSFDLSANGTFIDRNDVSHTVGLRVTGTKKQLQLIPSSPEGWDLSTTWLVLVTGRSPDEWRRVGVADPSAPSSSVASGASDTIAKTASGALIGEILSDPIRRVLRFDTVSIEVGASSALSKGCFRFGRYLKTCGQAEYGFVGNFNGGGLAELKVADWFSALARAEYLTQGVETLQQSLTRGRIELNFRIPLGY